MSSRSRTRSIVAGILATGCVVASNYLDPILASPWVPRAWTVHRSLLLMGLVATSGAMSWVAIHAGRPSREVFVNVLGEHYLGQLRGRPGVRVSVLAVRRAGLLRCLTQRFLEGDRDRPRPREYLVLVGRVPQEAGGPVPPVRFQPEEGVAGLCWDQHVCAEQQDLPDFRTHPEEWYDFSWNHLGIPRAKAERLRKKCRSYVCAPIFDGYDKTRLRGILCVDGEQPGAFSRDAVVGIRRLGHVLGHLPS